MKPLHQFINEAMIECPVFESFGSTIVGEILSKLKKSLYESKNLLSMFKWDEITDDDIEKVTPEEARKLAYKKDSNAVILWISSDNELLADTVGHYSIVLHSKANDIGLWWDNCKTVRKLASNADYAIVIKDPDKFSTAKLRELRREMKRDALAFKTEEQVKEENMKKFEKMKQQMILDKDANSATLEAKFEKAKAIYDECATAIENIEILKDKVKYFGELNDKFLNLLGCFEDIFDRLEAMKEYDTEYRTSRAVAALNTLNTDFSEFEKYCQKLLVKISD